MGSGTRPRWFVFSLLLTAFTGHSFPRSPGGTRNQMTANLVGTEPLTLISALFFRPDPACYSQIILMAGSLSIGTIVLWYLWRPQVKSYFGRR